MERSGRKVIRADPTLRILTVVGVVLVLVGGIIAVGYTESFVREVRELARESPGQAAERVRAVLRALTVGVAVIPVAVGAYLTRVAVLALRSGEFPPPGTRVLRDTTVTTGPASRRWAVLGLVVAGLLVTGGIAVPVGVWQLVGR